MSLTLGNGLGHSFTSLSNNKSMDSLLTLDDLDFNSGFSLDFSSFQLASTPPRSASPPLRAPSPVWAPSPVQAKSPTPPRAQSTPPVLPAAPPAASAETTPPVLATVPLAAPAPSPPQTPTPEPILATPTRTPALTRSPSLPSLFSSPITPILPAASHSLSRPQSPNPCLKNILLSPGDILSPTTTPPPCVTFALPPPQRLPHLGASLDVRGSRTKRRVQVGAYGELTWVSEPVRHTQPEAQNQLLSQDAAGASTRGRIAPTLSHLAGHHRSHSWNGGGPSSIGARRQAVNQDPSKDWLIAYHVQQMTHKRERQKQKQQQQRQKEQRERAEWVFAPSHLSREAGRPTRLPSITEEATRPPRSTSLTTLPTTSRPMRSSSLSAVNVSRPVVELRETGSDPFAKSPRSVTPTSPLAQTPITRVPSSPTAAKDQAPTSPRLPRRPSLLNLTLRRAALPLKIDFGFRKGKGKHSRSNSQSSKTSETSESNSESSEDSFGTMETMSEHLQTPVSPVPLALRNSLSTDSSVSISSFVSAEVDAEAVRSVTSFGTAKSTLSCETVTPRSTSPNQEAPRTPESRTPGNEPGTPDSDIIATPQAPIGARSWPQVLKGEVGEEEFTLAVAAY